MLRWLAIIGAILVAITIALSFHQPPMRRLPAPAAFKDGLPNAIAANAALATDNRIELFYATNRLAVGARNNRTYAIAPGRELHLGVGMIRIGEPETTWDKIYALATGSCDDRRPQLTLERLVEFACWENDPLPPGARAWFRLIDAALERSADKDIIIYVHGANSSVERAAGQAPRSGGRAGGGRCGDGMDLSGRL